MSLSDLDETPPRIDLVFPVLPPILDGIGDHTAHLAQHLASLGVHVRILTTPTAARTTVPGVDVVDAFTTNALSGTLRLADTVRQDPPSLLFLQFNQFSYGTYGFNPFLPWVLRRIRRACPTTRIVLMAHEEFVPPSSVRNAVMSTWQRAQFWALGRTADVIGFSTSSWVDKFRPWFPDTDLRHLPVGSNVPHSLLSRSQARRRLSIDASFVVGYFGSIGGSRHLEPVRRAMKRLDAVSDGRALLLYVGLHGAALRAALGDIPLYDAGPLAASDVGDHFAAMDLYLAPFAGGVSTRRGSFMTSLQHGIPTVATMGLQTDPIFFDHNGDALLLAPESDANAFATAAVRLYEQPAWRRSIGRQARWLYRAHFDWPVLAETVGDLVPRGAPHAPFSSSRSFPDHSFPDHHEGTHRLA